MTTLWCASGSEAAGDEDDMPRSLNVWVLENATLRLHTC